MLLCSVCVGPFPGSSQSFTPRDCTLQCRGSDWAFYTKLAGSPLYFRRGRTIEEETLQRPQCWAWGKFVDKIAGQLFSSASCSKCGAACQRDKMTARDNCDASITFASPRLGSMLPAVSRGGGQVVHLGGHHCQD